MKHPNQMNRLPQTPTIEPVALHNAITGMSEAYAQMVRVYEHRLSELRMANMALTEHFNSLAKDKNVESKRESAVPSPGKCPSPGGPEDPTTPRQDTGTD